MIIDKIFDSRYQDTWNIKYEKGKVFMTMAKDGYLIQGRSMVIKELPKIEHKPSHTIFETEKQALLYLDNMLSLKGVK